VSEVGGFSGQALDFEKPMDELGIDSLIQIEIVSKLKHKFIGQSTLDHRILYNCNTLQDVENALKSSIQASSHQDMLEVIQDVNLTASGQPTPALSDCSTLDELPRNPSPIHLSTKENTPLCLFHDGSGQVQIYGNLPKYERSTYAFFDPYFGLAYDQRPHCSVQKMAGHYVSLLTHMKNVPLIVGGTCSRISF
jgi:acyl carrier protein